MENMLKRMLYGCECGKLFIFLNTTMLKWLNLSAPHEAQTRVPWLTPNPDCDFIAAFRYPCTGEKVSQKLLLTMHPTLGCAIMVLSVRCITDWLFVSHLSPQRVFVLTVVEGCVARAVMLLGSFRMTDVFLQRSPVVVCYFTPI